MEMTSPEKPRSLTRTIGLSAICVSLCFSLVEKISGLAISTFLAKKICGSRYMVEPNPQLAAQGILTDAACGFDTDMLAAAFAVLTFVLGIIFLTVSFFVSRKRRSQARQPD